MANKNTIFYGDTFTYESMAGNFAFGTHRSTFLYFHESADLCSRADGATVKIYEIWMVDDYTLAELNVTGDHDFPHHYSLLSPSSSMKGRVNRWLSDQEKQNRINKTGYWLNTTSTQ